MSRGGRRPGSGRKPKSDFEREITGNPGRHEARVLAHPSGGQIPVEAVIEECDAPDELTMEERRVWMKLAPKAMAAGTFISQMSHAFGVLCQNIVRERRQSADPMKDCGPAHLKLIAMIDTELLRFNLSPCGKPIYKAESVVKPVNPLERFLARKRL